MPEQSQIDAEANQSDLAQRVAVLEDTIATLRRNLLEPAMTRPGLLRYGRNVMQLDGQGIQIVNSSSLNAPSLFYVPEFRTDADGTTPYAVLQGGANVVAGDEDVAALEMGIYPDTGLEGQVGLQSFNTATGVVGAFMSVESGGVISDLTLLTSAGAATLTLSNAVAILSVTADPTSFTNGMIWYNSTTNLFKARINGSTVTLGSGVATDAIWAAAGDLVYGTGNDTATILSGSSEDGYYLRYSTLVNAPVWNPWLKVSNQTGDFSASGGNFYRVTATATVTMPTASVDGRMLRIINVGSGNVTVNRTSSDTFFYGTTGLTSHTILPGECFTYTAYAGGNEWLVS